MSGRLGSNDIEDVVSSVRRLVSAEDRVRPVTRDLGQDKLLLTPSLRVISDTGKDSSAVPTNDPTAPLILQGPIGAPVSPTDASPADQSGIVEAEWEDKVWAGPAAPLAEMALGAEEAEVLVSPDQPEVEGLTEVEADFMQAGSSSWAQTEEEDWDDSAPVPFVHLKRAQAAETRILSDAEVPIPDAAAPEEAPSTPSDTMIADAVAETSVPAAARPAETIPLVDADGNELTVLDEEALHEIVRNLIRDELRGMLGERITHSVRKLVRAEINKALAARQLD